MGLILSWVMIALSRVMKRKKVGELRAPTYLLITQLSALITQLTAIISPTYNLAKLPGAT